MGAYNRPMRCFLVAIIIASSQARAQSTPVSGRVNERMGLLRDPRLAAALSDISAARIRATDSTLVGFGTRHTMSDTFSSKARGVGAARRWIYRTLTTYSSDCGGCLHVEYDPAMVVVQRDPQKRSVNVVNVLAWLPGRDTSRVIVMGGHYDSCRCSLDAFDATNERQAPTMMARARPRSSSRPRVCPSFSTRIERDHCVRALFGRGGASEHSARYISPSACIDRATRSQPPSPTTSTAMWCPRMAASTQCRSGSSLPIRTRARAVSWGGTSGRSIASRPAFSVLPVFRVDRIHRGGDHMPFVEAGDAGLRFTERLEDYARQHLPTDDFAHVNFGYTARVARLNGATVGALAAAPATPDSVSATRDVATSGGQRWSIAWKPVPGAVRYEVLVRRTISPTYERVLDAGATSPFTLDEQLNDLWAGVRAVGLDGARSLTAPLPAPAPARAR